MTTGTTTGSTRSNELYRFSLYEWAALVEGNGPACFHGFFNVGNIFDPH